MAHILVIDDDRLLNETLNDMLTRKKHIVESAYTISEGLATAGEGGFDVIFLDVLLPDGNGLDIVPQLKNSPSEPEIIIMTGRGDENGAEIAVQCGAWCYIEKSTITRELILPLTRVLEYREERNRIRAPKILDRQHIVGSSDAISGSIKLVGDAACSDVNVLLRGETGTGKEVFANTIHVNSSRAAKGNFVVVDCTSLPETLVESILFGHVKGAFTGADAARKGLVDQANGGTLFLDEIGELPMAIQKSFLRVLQERRYRPVGATHEEESNFRLIAATNRNLDDMVKNGTFRQDLLFRIRSMEIVLPPLRERGDDIQELAEYFIKKLCRHYEKENKMFSPEFSDALMTYSWPGNVRELANAMENVFSTSIDSPNLYSKNLPENIRIEFIKSTLRKDSPLSFDISTNFSTSATPILSWKEFKDKSENEYLQRLMAHTGNNIKEVCRISGLSKARVYQLINKHNLQPKTAL